MGKLTYANKSINTNPSADPSTLPDEKKWTVSDANMVKQVVNELDDTKATLDQNGKVLTSQLPSYTFEGLEGDGSAQNPFRFGGNAETYLKNLPGYDENTALILYSNGLAGFSWGPIPSGTLEKLDTPTLTLGTAGFNTIPLSWTSVADATGYIVQRSTASNFAGAVVVYNGSATNFQEYTLDGSTQYYYRVRATAAGYESSEWDAKNTTTAAGGNITPAAPTNGAVDDTNDTFDFIYASGYSSSIADYEYSLDGGTTINTVTTKPIPVGNVAKAAGQVRVRVKASTGRNASSWLSNTVPFTVSSGAELGQPITSFQYLSNMTSDGAGNVNRTDLANSGALAANFSIADAQVGFVSQTFPSSFPGVGEGSTGVVSLGVGVDPHYGDADALIAVWAQTGGGLVYRVKGAGAIYSANGVVAANGIIRIRVDLTTAFLEVSNNNGVSFTTITSTSRPVGTLRTKINAQGNQHKVVNYRSYVA